MEISGLSGGFVKKHKQVLLDAVVSYKACIADEMAWPQAIRRDPDLVNLPRLKTRIASCDRVEENEILIEGAMLRLLRTVATDFRSRLGILIEESKPWTDKRGIKAQLVELNEDKVREALFGEPSRFLNLCFSYGMLAFPSSLNVDLLL